MALSTTRTLLTQTGINTHQVFDVGGLDSVGVATFSNFKTGTTNVHNVGIDVVSMFWVLILPLVLDQQYMMMVVQDLVVLYLLLNLLVTYHKLLLVQLQDWELLCLKHRPVH